MGFELDPVFYTETMVKILQNQGHLFYATRICEKVLSKDPDKLQFKTLLEGFKKNPNKSEKPFVSAEDEITDPGITFEALESSERFAPKDPLLEEKDLKKQKLDKLYQLLNKVKERS